MARPDPFETYLAATRRSLPDLIHPEIYTQHLEVARAVAHVADEELRVDLCYTSERRSEAVSHRGDTVIFYDQYLGQSLSNISRIVYESEGHNFALNYCAKILAEFFRAYGATREAFICARTHSEERWKLRNLPKTRRRVASVFFQERFLMLHEVYHHVLSRDPALRLSLNEVLNRYFDHLDRARATANPVIEEAEGLSPDLLYPRRESFSVGLQNEMCCDFLAFAATVNSTGAQKKLFGRDPKKLAAMGCLEALKGAHVIHTLRDSVVTFVRRSDTCPDANLFELMQDYQRRGWFMNWLCNADLPGVMMTPGGLRSEIDRFLDRFHDTLGVVAFSLSESILQNRFDDLFEDDAAFVDDFLAGSDLPPPLAHNVIDAMTGWYNLPKGTIDKARKSPRSLLR